ncbi:response regulator transcription factor [Nitrospirillum iridis]|uniref:DNA-binding response OmpR family regulator n=1 Tax=Nitrospirillum iridis TaxID=765888 RepID=A0A7X0EG09_9PROT|nr:response regulator transcription factor [Nitrospirillum iridis]MBB6253636.1 DNA-binding response OmpR family regulator [Nitrospirillum iridis]
MLIEDDETLRHLLAEQLTALEEFDVHLAGDGAAALAAARSHWFDAILLASRLPDMEGSAVCAALREAGTDCPILLMAAEGEADVAGCSDRLVKPFRIGALLAKLRQHARPTGGDDATILRIGPYEFRALTRTLRSTDDGVETRLTDKEAQILAYLHRAEGTVVSRERLLDQVWNYNEGVASHTLETHIYRLRQKMERDPANAVLLVTEPGGYRLVL